MKFKGLTAKEVEKSRKKHGSNSLTQIPPDPLWKKILEGFKDPLDFAEASRELPTRIVTPRQIDASRKERREEAASDGTAPSVRVHAQTSAAKPLPKPLSDDDVTARTASMWKYLPVPEDQPEPYPETIQGTVDFPGSRIIAARVRGKMHKHEGTNCDDWYELAHLDRITFHTPAYPTAREGPWNPPANRSGRPGRRR